jgi:hypothetical protein
MRWYAPPALLVDGQVGVAGGSRRADGSPHDAQAYSHAVLLWDGYQPTTGGTQPPDPLLLETLAPSAQPAAAEPRYRYYPMSAFVDAVPSLPPSAARSVLNPALAR